MRSQQMDGEHTQTQHVCVCPSDPLPAGSRQRHLERRSTACRISGCDWSSVA